MSVTPNKSRIATSWWGDATVDDLLVPLNGAADVVVATCSGTLRQRLVSAVYTTNVLTFTFTANTLQDGVGGAGQLILPAIEIGSSTLVDVEVSAVSVANQTIAVIFRVAAGTGTTPPAAVTGAKLHLFLPRFAPVD